MSTVQSFFIAWSEKVCIYLSVFKLYSCKHRNEPDSPVFVPTGRPFALVDHVINLR